MTVKTFDVKLGCLIMETNPYALPLGGGAKNNKKIPIIAKKEPNIEIHLMNFSKKCGFSSKNLGKEKK